MTFRAIIVFWMLIIFSGQATAQDAGDVLVTQALNALRELPPAGGEGGVLPGQLHPVHTAAKLLNDNQPVKCLTPHYIYVTQTQPDHPQADEVLQAFADISEAELLDVQFYTSPSGRFRFEYTLTGIHAVPPDDTNNSGVPDYVERAGGFADESYELMVVQQGFTDFLIPGRPYEFRFRQVNSYGYTQSQGATSFIVVHRNFDGFPSNDDPEGIRIGALKVTIAHEMKHAIQYAASRWGGETGGVAWVEMDATMMEEVVYDEVNDYYNYIRHRLGIFDTPNRSTPVAYHHVTWMLYYYERFGIHFWVDIWNRIQANPQGSTMVGLMSDKLAELGTAFDDEFTQNHKWHFASGVYRIQGYGFDEASAYPPPRRTFQTAEIDSVREVPGLTNRRAAQYLFFDDISSLVGNIRVSLEFDGTRAGLGIIGYRSGGVGDTWYGTAVRSEGGGFLVASPPMRWDDYTSLALIIANPTDEDQRIFYSVLARELPLRMTLYQNYPNPFNTRTTLSFALLQTMEVTLEVYDLTGRRVARLIDGEVLNRGFYEIPFDAQSLPSGVYLTIMKAGRLNRIGKMTLIR
jgi:hypothetical protein